MDLDLNHENGQILKEEGKVAANYKSVIKNSKKWNSDLCLFHSGFDHFILTSTLETLNEEYVFILHLNYKISFFFIFH